MFNPFKRKSKERPLRRAAAQRVMLAILQVQRRIADRLNGQTRGWSKRQQCLFLSLVAVSFSGSGAYSVLRGCNAAAVPAISPAQGIRSVPLASSFRSREQIAFLTELAEVRRLRRLLDSLRNDSSTKEQYHQFITSRPGLQDSLAQLEAYYEELTKTNNNETKK